MKQKTNFHLCTYVSRQRFSQKENKQKTIGQIITKWLIMSKPKQKNQHFIQKVSTNQIDIHINLTRKKTKKNLKANEFKT